MAKKIEIKYALEKIRDVKFHLNSPTKSFSEHEFSYTINPGVKYNIKGDSILIKVKVSAIVKETEENVLDCEIAFFYAVTNLQEIMEEVSPNMWGFKDPKDEGLLITLFGLSLSTARGIIYARTKGTVLDEYPIPLMNPASFIESKKPKV